MTAKLRSTITGAFVGAIPGLVVLVVNAAFVAGEAQLTLGVIGIFLLLAGAVAGAAGVGARVGAVPGWAVIGVLVGMLPGLLVYRLVPGHPAAVAVILAGAAGGGLAWARFAQRRQPQAH